MNEGECPSCRSPPLGGQIVTLPHATTDAVTYAVVCPNCGAVYRDKQARKQIEEDTDAD
jgi:predicted RNA-binding Zn-ribbon protein involved in translation (DUF1610 family)